MWEQIADVGSVGSEPVRARVSVCPYGDSSVPWQPLGTTAIADVRLAKGVYQWQFEKEGFDTVTLAAPAPLLARLWP